MSNETEGGHPIADTGDYSDPVCPKCCHSEDGQFTGAWITVEEIPPAATCSGVYVWAEDSLRTARKCVYNDGEFVRFTREARSTIASEWAIVSERIAHKDEIRAAFVFIPNAESADGAR
jgi:hypothetical protein